MKLSTLNTLNWVHIILLSVTPLLALYAVVYVPLKSPTMSFAFLYYFITAFGITGGYHRYWSHRTYNAHPIFQLLLMLAGSGGVIFLNNIAVQGSIL